MCAVTFQSMPANLVAGLVVAHLLELHALAAKYAGILAAEHRVDGTPGADLDVANLPRQLGGDHGTGTASRISATKSSAVRSSASAS